MTLIRVTTAAATTVIALTWKIAGAQASPNGPVASPPADVTPVVKVEDPMAPTLTAHVAATLRSRGVVVSLRQYAGQPDAPEAVARIARAFAALLKIHGVQVWPAGKASGSSDEQPASIELDPSFYVYTQKFNAQRVRLPAYVAAQLHESIAESNRATASSVAASEQPVDALRLAAGALGIVTGFLSPSHGAYMVATGSRLSNTLNARTAALFGAGPAPVRLFGSHLDRYRHGEQEALVGLRVRTANVDERIVVKATAPGDDPPFAVDVLTAAAWQAAVEQLVGNTVPRLPRDDSKP